MNRIIPGFMLIVIGSTVLNWIFHTISIIKASANWPATQGVVYYSQVDKRTGTDSKGRSDTSYDVDIWYKYKVGGRQFKSGTFVYNVSHSFDYENEAQAEVAAYPVGKQVKVFYNPQQPEDSCLRPGEVPFGLYVASLLGITFVAGGGVAITAEVRDYQRR